MDFDAILEKCKRDFNWELGVGNFLNKKGTTISGTIGALMLPLTMYLGSFVIILQS